jgi:hypothetical protein
LTVRASSQFSNEVCIQHRAHAFEVETAPSLAE